VTIASRQDLDRNSRGTQHQREDNRAFVVGSGLRWVGRFRVFRSPPLIIPPQPSSQLVWRRFKIVSFFFSISPSAAYPGSFPPSPGQEHLWHLQIGNAIQERASLLFFAGVLAGPIDNYPRLFIPTGVRQAEPSMGVVGGSLQPEHRHRERLREHGGLQAMEGKVNEKRRRRKVTCQAEPVFLSPTQSLPCQFSRPSHLSPFPRFSGVLLLDLYSSFKLLWDRSGYPTVRGVGGKGGRIGNRFLWCFPGP